MSQQQQPDAAIGGVLPDHCGYYTFPDGSKLVHTLLDRPWLVITPRKEYVPGLYRDGQEAYAALVKLGYGKSVEPAPLPAIPNQRELSVGDHVEKVGGDYTFEGTVVAAFYKLDTRSRRYVVEDVCGVLHIYSGKNLRPTR